MRRTAREWSHDPRNAVYNLNGSDSVITFSHFPHCFAIQPWPIHRSSHHLSNLPPRPPKICPQDERIIIIIVFIVKRRRGIIIIVNRQLLVRMLFNSRRCGGRESANHDLSTTRNSMQNALQIDRSWVQLEAISYEMDRGTPQLLRGSPLRPRAFMTMKNAVVRGDHPLRRWMMMRDRQRTIIRLVTHHQTILY